jgi:hypothetical protein
MKYLALLALSTLSVTAACSNTEMVTEIQGEPVQLTAGAKYEGPGQAIAHVSASERVYIGSPSIAIMPNGNYFAAHDFFGPGAGARDENGLPKTRIYRSMNRGKTWTFHSELIGQVSSNLFVHKNKLYAMGVSKAAGDLVIRHFKAITQEWTTPTSKLTGLITDKTGRYHTAPTPTIEYNGRLWRAVENQDGANQIWPKWFQAMMISAPVNSDLLNRDSWTLSNAMPYDSTYVNGYFYGWLEGNAVLGPNNTMFNMLRVHTFDKYKERAAMVNLSSDGKTATFNSSTGFVWFPGGGKKFTIRYDSLSKKYWSLANYVLPADEGKVQLDKVRNTLALISSDNLVNWKIDSTILHHDDTEFHGFQYADWQFDGNDIIAVSRTSYDDGLDGANDFHNSNFLTFHRIEGFRTIQSDNISYPIPKPR